MKNRRKTILPIAAAVAMSAACPAHAFAADSGIKPPMMLEYTFADIGGVRSWKKGSDTVVFIKNKADQWYKVELQEACMAYDTKSGISFVVETDPETQRKSNAVVVARHICRVASLTRVASPDNAQ
jgi:hypothetical protein